MTTGEIDLNQVAAELFSNLLKDIGRSAANAVTTSLANLFSLLRKDFSVYLANTLDKCSFIKPLLIYRDSPTHILNIYVHSNLSFRHKTYTDDELIAMIPPFQEINYRRSSWIWKIDLHEIFVLTLM